MKTELETSLNVSCEFVGRRVRKAHFCLKKENLTEAIKGYEIALKIDNINKIVSTNFGNLYYRNNDFKNAEEIIVKGKNIATGLVELDFNNTNHLTSFDQLNALN